MKKPFLVAYDYGQGAVWAFIRAESQEEIERDFPELKVIDDPPGWLDGPRRKRMEETMTFDIDERTVGLLAELIDDRDRSGGGP